VDVWKQKLTDILKLCKEEMEADKEEHPGRNWQMKANPLMRRNDEGILVPLRPKGSTWYVIYVESPALDNNKFRKKFRKHFRNLYSHFFGTHQNGKRFRYFILLGFDAVGKESPPIESMVLGALHHLVRGWTFYNLEELTTIHEKMHQFFHAFIEWGSTVLFDCYVVHPTNAEEAATHMHEMGITGFDGCVASSDAKHVMAVWLHQMQNMLGWKGLYHEYEYGGKAEYAFRTYNMTVNHR
jgi:hypothetical protein